MDSEDIPLNLSRELLQDGLLVAKLRRVLAARIIKWFNDEAKKNPEKYNQFYKNFAIFIKEGVCTDADNKVFPIIQLELNPGRLILRNY